MRQKEKKLNKTNKKNESSEVRMFVGEYVPAHKIHRQT